MRFESAHVPPPSLSPRQRWFLCNKDGVVVRAGAQLATLDASDALALGIDRAAAHYLGRLDGDDCFAAAITATPAAPYAVRGLRSLMFELDEALFTLAGRAVQVIAW